MALVACGGVPDFPRTADRYEARDLVYFHSLGAPQRERGIYSCCRDFGEISKDFIEQGRNDFDNALMGIMDALEPFIGGSFQDELDSNLEEGNLVVLLDHWGYRKQGEPFTLVGLSGVMAEGTSWANASTGHGEFLIDPAGFEEGTGTPITRLEDAAVDGRGWLVAESDVYPWSMSILGATLALPLRDMRLIGNTSTNAHGRAYERGELSGYLTVDEFMKGFNDLLENDCSCLGLTESVFHPDGANGWTSTCLSDAADRCPDPADEICVSFAQEAPGLNACALLPTVISEAADLDLDPASEGYEALSFGLFWDAVPATSVGLMEATP